MLDETINTDVTMRDAAPAGGVKRFHAGDEILGRYVVESELGQGGMGVVYLCLDKVGGVKVAVKGLPPEVSHNSDEMEEVRRNFQLVCALRHPGIAGIRTLEREESTGLYYLVMDIAEGQNLTRWMREHDEPGLTPEKLTILRDIASALDYAHERRILHRDIKPGNVMVGPDGHAQVLDFGLAAQIRSSMSRVSLMVTSQSGTPAYKSPEQWKGRPQRAAADQYSLAVIAYKMISGELPFDGDDLTMLGRAVMNETPEKVAGVPASVNAALQKALAKEPEDRFESCAAFVAALSSDGRARTPSAPLKWIAASVILLALAAVGGWWWRERVKSEELRVKNEALAVERARQAEEVKRVEEARVAAEKAEVERKAKVEDAERKAKLEAERVAEENRKAEELKIAAERVAETEVFRLSSKAESAHTLIEREDAEVKAFFEAEIRAFENDRRAGDDAKRLSKNIVATNFFVQALAKATNLKALVDGRAKCQNAKAAVERAQKAADEMNAGTMLVTRYGEAKGKVDEAARAAEAKSFERANACYTEASKLFVALRKDIVKATLELARDHKSAERWQDCLALAEKVLGWEPDNAESAALKIEAERHLMPKIGAPWTIVLPDGAKMEMMWCPPGNFMMGSPTSDDPRFNDEKQHKITLTQGFWMGKYEVTQRQWESVMGMTLIDLVRKALCDDTKYDIEGNKKTIREGLGMEKDDNPSKACGDKAGELPIYFVSWNEAKAFCEKLTERECAAGRLPNGYRYCLPTEAEWEYACRAGTSSPLPNGRMLNVQGLNNAPALDDIAWYGGNSSVGFSGVGWDTTGWAEKQYPGGRACARKCGLKEANRFGLYDMIGNVWEWCADWYASDYGLTSSLSNLAGPASGSHRVYRGGGWDTYACGCRSACRSGGMPGYRCRDLGFRVCCSAGPHR